MNFPKLMLKFYQVKNSIKFEEMGEDELQDFLKRVEMFCVEVSEMSNQNEVFIQHISEDVFQIEKSEGE